MSHAPPPPVTKAVGPPAPTASQPAGSVLSVSVPLSLRDSSQTHPLDATPSSASFPDTGCREPTQSRRVRSCGDKGLPQLTPGWTARLRQGNPSRG